MKIFYASIVALMIIFQSVGFVAVKTFSASGEYLMSDYDTPEIAELRALDYARRNAVEQAGVYLESYLLTADFQLEEAEIKIVASNNIKILGEPKIIHEILPGGIVKIRVDINTTVDTADLEAVIKNSQEKRQQAIKQYEDLQKITLKLDNDIAALKKKIAKLKDDEPEDEISEEQERIDREFLSKQKLDELFKFIYSKDLTYYPNIIDEAIKLNPKNFQAYAFRSMSDMFKLVDEMKNIISLNQNELSSYKWNAELNIDFKSINKAMILASDNESKCKSIILLAEGYEFKAFNNQRIGNKDEGRQNLDKALEFYNKAIEIDPNRANSYSSRGRFYKGTLKDYDKALADYTKAIELEPNDAGAYKERSNLYMELKNYSAALKDLENCKKLDEEHFYSSDYVSLGVIYEKLKNYPRALESYTKAIKIEQKLQINWLDERPYAYVCRAKLYIELGEFDKAIADCENAIKVAENTEMKILLQSINEMKQFAVKGKSIEDKYGKISDKDVDSLIKRGDDYCKEKFYLLAIEDYTQAISIDPKNGDGEAYIKRGLVYENLGDYKKALNDYDKALEINSNKAVWYSFRAHIHEELGNFEKSINDCNKTIELLPMDNKLTQGDRLVILNITLERRQRVLDKLKK